MGQTFRHSNEVLSGPRAKITNHENFLSLSINKLQSQYNMAKRLGDFLSQAKQVMECSFKILLIFADEANNKVVKPDTPGLVTKNLNLQPSIHQLAIVQFSQEWWVKEEKVLHPREFSY